MSFTRSLCAARRSVRAGVGASTRIGDLSGDRQQRDEACALGSGQWLKARGEAVGRPRRGRSGGTLSRRRRLRCNGHGEA